MKPLIAIAATLLAQGAAHAHEGHGLPGPSHWHPTDTVGILLAAVGVIAIVWISRRGK